MNDTELLKYQIKTIEKNLLNICKDINNRLNKLENDIEELRSDLNANRFK